MPATKKNKRTRRHRRGAVDDILEAARGKRGAAPAAPQGRGEAREPTGLGGSEKLVNRSVRCG